MKLFFRLAAVLEMALLTGACTSVATQAHQSKAPPASVSLRAVQGGKPPMRIYNLRLDLVNREDRPTWIVMRYYLDKALPASDGIVAGAGDWLQFGDGVLSQGERAAVYQWHQAASRTLQCVGRFQALQLPAHGELHIADCQMDAWEPVGQFEIWEASEIVINGSTPLKQWIAGRTVAPDGSYATPAAANRDPRQTAAMGPSAAMDHAAPPRPTDVVSSVEFRDVRRWTLPIAQIDQQPRDPWNQ